MWKKYSNSPDSFTFIVSNTFCLPAPPYPIQLYWRVLKFIFSVSRKISRHYQLRVYSICQGQAVVAYLQVGQLFSFLKRYVVLSLSRFFGNQQCNQILLSNGRIHLYLKVPHIQRPYMCRQNCLPVILCKCVV